MAICRIKQTQKLNSDSVCICIKCYLTYIMLRKRIVLMYFCQKKFKSLDFNVILDLVMWVHVVKGSKVSAFTNGLDLPDRRVDPDCWLRLRFEYP